MPRYTHATRLAATFLAKQSGAKTAATAFGIDLRTIRSWLATVEIPDDAWTAIRDVLQARAAEMAAKGETRGLVQTLTGAGISERNVRYGQLIARRVARKAGTDAETEANDADADLRTRIDEWDVPTLGKLATVGMTDEQYRALLARVVPMAQAEADAWWPVYIAELHTGCIAEYVSDGIRVLRDGVTVHDTRSNLPALRRRLPYEWRGVPVFAAGVPNGACLVNPPQLAEMVAEAEQLLLETAP